MLDPAFLKRPIAHRGLHERAAGRIENSLSAAAAAVDHGFGIELDLQISSDGQAMVFHDETLDRVTGETGWVAERTAAELGRVGLKNGDDGIPTFRELLDLVAGRVPLLVELKDQTAHPNGQLGPLEADVADALRTYAGPVALMSFHPGMVANLARMAPGITRGLTGLVFEEEHLSPEDNAALTDYSLFDATDSSFVSHDWHTLCIDSIARLKARGVPILCWTVRSATDEVTARTVADNITFEGYLPL